jgi:hypothetical protein
MAKKEEKKPVILTPENVVEEAKKGNTLTPELRQKMEEELKEQKDKRILSEVKARHAKIGYLVGIGLINVKKMRAYADTSLYNIRQQGRLQRFLCGFEVTEQVVTEFAKTPDDVLELEVLDEKKSTLKIKVLKEDGKTREEKEFKVGDTVPAIIDYTEFDNALVKLEDNLNKRMKDIDKQYREDSTVLEQAAGEYWRSDWRYNVHVVTNDGLSNRRSW